MRRDAPKDDKKQQSQQGLGIMRGELKRPAPQDAAKTQNSGPPKFGFARKDNKPAEPIKKEGQAPAQAQAQAQAQAPAPAPAREEKKKEEDPSGWRTVKK